MASLLSHILDQEKVYEGLKQELVLSNTFHLDTLFEFFADSENNINKFTFQKMLNSLHFEKIYSKSIDILFGFYDRDNSSTLNLEEFTHILSPEQKEYKILLNCKMDKVTKRDETITFEEVILKIINN